MPPRFSYKNDSDEDQRASPQAAAKQLQDKEQAGYDNKFNGVTDPENFEKDGTSGDLSGGVRSDEDLGGGLYTPSEGGVDKPRLLKALTLARKRAPLFGLIGVLGIGGAIAASFLGPASMIVSVMENFTLSNDSSSTSLQSRFMKVFGSATTGDPSGLCAGSNSIKCHEGRISNSALKKLSAKDVIPYGADNKPITIKATGYPSENPKGYTIDLKDGSAPKNILAKDLPGFLTKYPKMQSRVLGAGGAFNMRFKAWSGKYITEKLFRQYNLKRDGGLADGKNKTGKYSEVLAKLRAKIPGLKSLDNIKGNISKKLDAHLGKAKKGGTGYTLAVAGCIAVKAPAYIAAGVAAVQLAQILPVVMNVFLSPGSKLVANGVDPSVGFTSQDASSIGNLVTEKTPRASDGKMSSALDSPYLQSALGINKNKLPISKDYTPGYSILTSSIVIGSIAAEKASAPFCNELMSPASMYTAAAVDAGVSIAAGGTVVGGIVKIVGGWLLTKVTGDIVKSLVGSAAILAVTSLASNDLIPKAKGEDLGTILGLGALAFFSSGGMARSLPTLKMGQLSQFVAIQQQEQNSQRAMDVASLSPFDTSSRYTFMGSIVHNMRMATLTNGSYSGGMLSMLSSAVKLPFGLSNNASAATSYTEATCGYAADFGLGTSDPANDPATNVAGLPCTGFTTQEASMPTDTAISLVENEGWLDQTKPIADGATISDLVQSGYIVADTPLSNYINSCSDASTGDYIYNAASCTIDTNAGDTSRITSKLGSQAPAPKDASAYTSTGLVDGNSMAAIPVFLLDFQSAQMINGEDEGNNGAPVATTSAIADATIDQAHIYDDSSSIACAAGTTDAGINQGYNNGKEVDVRLCGVPNTLDMGQDSNSTGPIRVNSRVSGAVLQMINALIASPVNNGKVPLRVSDSFRSMAGQRAIAAEYGIGRAAAPGYSNHQMGIAIDFQLGGAGNVGQTRPGDPTYDWLVTNAKNYGFAKLSSEAWHWQAIAAQGSRVM